MAKRSDDEQPKRRKKGDEPVKAKTANVLHRRTTRSIVAVVMCVVAIIILLAALNMAGVAGIRLFNALYAVFGIGSSIIPFLLATWAVALVRSNYEDRVKEPIRTAGALLGYLSLLGMVFVISEHHGGFVGMVVARPLTLYLDTMATFVILSGLVIVSLLLLFDAELWIGIFSKVRAYLFPLRTIDTSEPEDTDCDENQMPVKARKGDVAQKNSSGTPPEADNGDEDDAEEITDEDEPPLAQIPQQAPVAVPPKKRAPVIEIPSEYTPPPLSLLEADRGKPNVGDTKARANIIKRTLQHFRIPVEMDEIVVGPSVTRYSLKPAEGVRLSKIVALQSNLELALAAAPIRIEAPIPGKSLVGIEVPNTGKSIVGLAGLLSSPEFTEETLPLFVALGKDIAGIAHYANIGKMPHLLVAGTTGSGKSVMIHTLIVSLLYRNGPERLRFIMVDPKRVELTLYNSIPHLLTPVITDAKRCILALKWAAKEMDRRYDLLQQHRVQDIAGYHNDVVAPALADRKEGQSPAGGEQPALPELMPHIVVFIDELADIMSAYPKELEAVIVRLAQMSRAVGIHLVLSTQRPEVKVITGLIKANVPSRIALKVNSIIDSRTIIDQTGAEKLLGAGDLLYLSGDMAKPRRIQSPFLTTTEVKKIVSFLAKNNTPLLDTTIDFGGSGGDVQNVGMSPDSNIPLDDMEQGDGLDDLYEDVREFVIRERKASTSLIQRRFKVGYGRAARIMDQLEERGVISGSDGTNRPREVIGAGGGTAGPMEDTTDA